jgi:hypothetical protein
MILRRLLFSLTVIVLSLSAFAQEKGPLTGLWKCTLKFDGGAAPDQAGEMDLRQNGKDVKGTGSNAGGSAPITGTFEDGKYTLKVEAEQAPWAMAGKLEDGKLAGTWAIAAASVKGTMECSKPVPASTASALTGLWKCVSKFEGAPDSPFQLDLIQKGEELTGTGSNANGTAPLKGTIKDGKFTFQVDAGDTKFDFAGSIENGKISGTLAIPAANVKGTFEGKKS